MNDATIKELMRRLAESEEHAGTLSEALMTLGSLLREHAIQLRKDARALQGLQGKCYGLAEKLDDYAAQVLLGTLPKGKPNEQTPSHQG